MIELSEVQREILAELARQVPPDIAENEVTAKMFERERGITYDMARRILEGEVEAGRMTRREVLVDGNKAFGYRKI